MLQIQQKEHSEERSVVGKVQYLQHEYVQKLNVKKLQELGLAELYLFYYC